MSVSEARAALPEVLEMVLGGEEVTITRHGQEVAVVVRPDVLRTRRADEALAAAERVRELLAQARGRRLHAQPRVSKRRAEALVADVQAARSGRSR